MCSYCDVFPPKSNGDFLVKKNFSIALRNDVAFLNNDFFTLPVAIQMCLLVYYIGAAFSNSP